MLPLIKCWLDICLLRAAPQDLPASGLLLAISLCCYAAISLLVSLVSYGFADAVRLVLLDLGVLGLFVVALLYLQNKTVRIQQTLTAMAGSGSVLGILALLLVLFVQPDMTHEQVPASLTLFWLILMIWNLLVMAHIMRHALSSSFITGVGVSLVYALLNMELIAAALPQ